MKEPGMQAPRDDTPLFEALEQAIVRVGAFVVGAAGRIRPVTDKLNDAENPTTDVDRETDVLLHEALMAPFVGRPAPVYLSEERPDDRARLQAREVFIVDPIDGTRNLLAGRLEATISVALWRDGDLAWGCVHQPFTGETYTAVRGGGARLNGAPIRATAATDLPTSTLVLSNHEYRKGWLAPLEGRVRCEIVGSCAYKMARVAAGLCDGTLTVNPRSQWDVAAGVLLVQEAGGMATDARGRPYTFNLPELLVDGVAASGTLLHRGLLTLADALRGG
jgi:myo-inositol-1(or 4)-monophosphatase